MKLIKPHFGIYTALAFLNIHAVTVSLKDSRIAHKKSIDTATKLYRFSLHLAKLADDPDVIGIEVIPIRRKKKVTK